MPFMEMPPLLRLPLETSDPDIMQGFHGPWHPLMPTQIDLTYALDFRTPVGTLVLAARDGIVKGLEMRSSKYLRDLTDIEGFLTIGASTNIIILQHDGFSTVYVHLGKNTQRVRFGQCVKEGQPLAETGLSGFVGPVDHLHFHAQCEQFPDASHPRRRSFTIPFRFHTFAGPLEHALIFPVSPSVSTPHAVPPDGIPTF
jgi:hypothetical protein